MSARLERYFEDYHEFHRAPGNKFCHFVGIPAIMVSLLGLLALIRIAPPSSYIPLLQLDAGVILWFFATLWYFWLDWRLAMPFSLMALAAYFLGRALPEPVLIAVFVLGWVFQGIGHAAYEKRSPAFFRNATHLFIGPFWIFASVFRSGR